MRNNAIDLNVGNNTDGFDISGGTTSSRKLTLSGSNVTLQGSGSSTITFPTSSTTLAGTNIVNSFSTNQILTGSLSISGSESLIGNLVITGTIAGGSNATNNGRGATLDLASNAAQQYSTLTLTNSGSIIFGTDTITGLGSNYKTFFAQINPVNTSAWGMLESWNSVGLAIGTGNTSGPLSLRVNRTEVAGISSTIFSITGSLTVRGTVSSSGVLLAGTIPTSISSSGTKGTATYDNSFLYVCTSSNAWKRATLSNF